MWPSWRLQPVENFGAAYKIRVVGVWDNDLPRLSHLKVRSGWQPILLLMTDRALSANPRTILFIWTKSELPGLSNLFMPEWVASSLYRSNVSRQADRSVTSCPVLAPSGGGGGERRTILCVLRLKSAEAWFAMLGGEKPSQQLSLLGLVEAADGQLDRGTPGQFRE